MNVKYYSIILGLLLFVNLTFVTVAQAQSNNYVPEEMIVKFKGDSQDNNTQQSINNLKSRHGMHVKRSWHRMNMHHIGLRHGHSVDQAVQDALQDPNVEFAEPNYYVKKATDGQPEKIMTKEEAIAQSAADQGGNVNEQSLYYSQTGDPVYVPEAWAQESNTAYQPIVAVIDTGMDLTHSALSGALWTNPGEIAANGIDDDHNGYVDDVHGWNFVNVNNNPQDCDGHGTHVSGIIRGTTQDIFATPLATAKIQIMPVKFLDCSGNGTTSDAVSAIYYAVNNGAKVLNNSWGGGSYSSSLLQAIAFAYNQKTSFVAAAGNYSTNNDVSPTFPASYTTPNMISVAANTNTDILASFSNYGAGTVHLSSPGVSIYSTWPGNSYATLSGTSMATPFVSGVIALMVREKPTMNGYQLKQLALASVDTKASLSGVVYTNGRVNALNSLVSAKNATVDSYMPTYNATISPGDRGLASNLVSNGAGCGLVTKVYSDYNQNNQTKFQAPRNVAFDIFMILFMMAVPFVVAITLKTQSHARRRWDRFVLGSKVYVESEGGHFLADVGTISMGGIEVKTDKDLKMDDHIHMIIESPDGKEYAEVDGKVVWSNQRQSYGVCFTEAKEQSLVMINEWTKTLVKS